LAKKVETGENLKLETANRFGSRGPDDQEAIMVSPRFGSILGFLIVALAFSAHPAGAGEHGDDEALARGLLRRGYLDLAEERFRALAGNSGDPELKARSRLGLIEVLQARAERELDPAAKKAFYDEALRKYRAFLEGREDPEALFKLAGLLRAKGMDFAREALRAEDGKQKEALNRESRKAFNEAASLFARYLESYESRFGDVDFDKAPKEEASRFRNASYNHADLHFHVAMTFDPGKGKWTETLKKADALFEEFIWNFEGFAQAYLAFIQRGRCSLELGEFGRAIGFLDVVLDLPADREASPEQKRLRDRLRIMASHRYLEVLVRAGRYTHALDRAGAFEREYPRASEAGSPDPDAACAALLEKAKALEALGRTAEAARTVLAVVERGGKARDWGMALLAGWDAFDDPRIGLEVLLLRAEGLARSGKFPDAVQAYEEALSRVRKDDERLEFGTRIWSSLAMVYAARNQYYEAGLAFQKGERVARPFLQDRGRPGLAENRLKALREQAAECAYNAYRAFKRAWESAGKERTGGDASGLRRAYMDQRRDLGERYSDSPFAKNILYFTAVEILEQGDPGEALRLFEKVEQDSNYYDAARVGFGEAHFQVYLALIDRARKEAEGNRPPGAANAAPRVSAKAVRHLDAAREELEAFRRRARKTTPRNEGEKARRAGLEAHSSYTLARVYVAGGKWKSAAGILEGFESAHASKPGLVISALYLRLRALVHLANEREVEDQITIIEEADEVLRNRTGKNAPSDLLIASYRKAAGFFEQLARGQGAMDRDRREEWERKSLDYFESWLELGLLGPASRGRPDRANLEALGARFYTGGRPEKAARCYEAILSGGEGMDGEGMRRFQRALGECYFSLERWSDALPLFAGIHRFEKSEDVTEKLALIHMRIGEVLREKGQTREAHGSFDASLGLYQSVMKRQQPEKRSWWVRQLAVWKIKFYKGEYADLVNHIKNARIAYPTLGGQNLKSEILRLFDRAKELAGKRGG